MAGGGWEQQRSLIERLMPLVGKDRFLVIEKVITDRDLGFGGGTTHTVAVTVKGPRKSDELYLYATRDTYEQAVQAVEGALR